MAATRCLLRWAKSPFRQATCLTVVCLGLAFTPGRADAQGGGDRLVPPQSYFSIFRDYYDGEYRRALKDFQSEGRGAIKTVASHWIDSISFHTMTGECYYHMGHLPEALEHYTAAIQLYVAFPEWMIRVQFPPTIQPANPGQLERITWGQSGRRATVGHYPDKMLIAQGQLNNAQQVQQGGVVQSPLLYPVNVQEIVRTTTLAIRRRRDLLGPASEHDQLTRQLITALERRQAPRGHWSQAWIDVQLGLAYTAAGRDAEAQRELQRSLVAAGEFDHPMTCIALLELGRLALAGGDFGAAATAFAEAGFAAAHFLDLGVLEESFRYGQTTHLVSNAPGLYAPLPAAAQWAQANRYRQLHASLLTLAAENHAVVGQPGEALRLLDVARGVIGRRDMGRGSLGARVNFTQAVALLSQGNVAAGNEMLAAALAFQKGGSHWLFQIGLVDRLSADNQVRDRVAMDLYEEVLREPTAADWKTDPLETLSVLATPHGASYENWFLTALARKAPERALEIADLARRHRFHSTLEMGGRLLSLRWLLEGPRDLLDQPAALQRQDLLVSFPQYGQLSGQADQLRARLDQMPLLPDDGDAARDQRALLGQWAEVSGAQELALRQIAVRRQPCDMVFPPRRTTQQVQQALGEGQGLLTFFSAGREMYGFLITNDKYGLWPVPRVDQIKGKLTVLLRQLGNFDPNRELTAAELRDETWKKTSAELRAMLLSGAKADNVLGDLDELIVVPDGLLWYVPFEALPVGEEENSPPMIARVKIRYAPTVALAVADPRPRSRSRRTVVALGRLYPRDDDAVAVEAVDRWGGAVPGAVRMTEPPQAPSDLVSTLFDGMIVLSDIPRGGAYDWAPFALDHGKAGSALANWFPLPWGGPDWMLLPGFHSAAEDGMKGQAAAAAGGDLFLATCGLMATGTRTVLISRWRAGGETSFELMRQFAQELPHAQAADAWRRSVLLSRDLPVDPLLEPRVKDGQLDEPLTAAHPFFWSGYLLVDTGATPAAAAPVQAAVD